MGEWVGVPECITALLSASHCPCPPGAVLNMAFLQIMFIMSTFKFLI